MQTRRALIVGVIALAAVSIAAVLAPQIVGAALAAFSVVVFLVALIGLSRPEWVRLPNRAASVWVWALSFGLLIAGSTLMAPPDGDVARSDAPRVAVDDHVMDPRVHADSSFRPEVQQLLRRDGLRLIATRAQAFHNDVEVWVNADATDLILSTTCDQQRDLAASLWAEWRMLGDVPPTGAGVTIKSSTGRTLASAEQGLTGAQFHCE